MNEINSESCSQTSDSQHLFLYIKLYTTHTIGITCMTLYVLETLGLD